MQLAVPRSIASGIYAENEEVSPIIASNKELEGGAWSWFGFSGPL